MTRPSKLTFQELAEHLNETVEALAVAAREYDAGQKSQVKILAMLARNLCHDTRTSISLLNQLGKKDSILFFGTPNNLQGEKQLPQFPLVRPTFSGWIGKGFEDSTTDADFMPVFDEFHGRASGYPGAWKRLKFRKWWDEHVLILDKRFPLSRKNIVLMTANKTGIGHIAPNLDERESHVIRQEAVRFDLIAGERRASPKHGMHYASMRQIGYELQKTIDAELSNLSRQPATTPLRPRTSMSQHSHLQSRHNREYLEKILQNLQEKGLGTSPEAEEIRRVIFWET